MNKITLQAQHFMETDSYNDLLQICKKGLDKISELGPSDNDTKLNLQKHGQQFFVTIQMMSMGLAFTLQSNAYSPFMAVEFALKEALGKVQKWSTLRQIV